MTNVSADRRPSPPPRYACPDLIARDGYWARPVKENLAGHGVRISFCLCPGKMVDHNQKLKGPPQRAADPKNQKS